MENFIYGDTFYSELGDLLEDLEIEEEDVVNLPDDYSLDIFYCELEPLVIIDAQWIEERINEERFPEENDRIFDEVHKAITESIDFVKLNSKMPRCYYPLHKKSTLTKKDILTYIN